MTKYLMGAAVVGIWAVHSLCLTVKGAMAFQTKVAPVIGAYNEVLSWDELDGVKGGRPLPLLEVIKDEK